jgi:hypothetical protein
MKQSGTGDRNEVLGVVKTNNKNLRHGGSFHLGEHAHGHGNFTDP